MRLTHHLIRTSVAVISVLAVADLVGAPLSASAAASRHASASFVALPDSARAVGLASSGPYRSARLSVEVVLAPRDRAGLAAELAAVYDPGGPSYHRWLARGQFAARYAPTPATRAAVASYLNRNGLAVTSVASPFLVRAAGSSQRVAAAFQTTLRAYRSSRGTRYFANSTAVRLPSALAPDVLGVVGLASTVRLHPQITPPARSALTPPSRPAMASSGCQDTYPSRQELLGNLGELLQQYAGAPGCSGLTPSQLNSIYGAPRVGARAEGAGVKLAVFEQSGYRESDIGHWADTFYGSSYRPRLANINVDGGPLHPACPAGDTCPRFLNGYAADIEVDADIETELAIAPDAARILVYNSPGDTTGQTELDEFSLMASQDQASVINSSYGECEQQAGVALTQAENVIFEQLALQGQSMLSASGDDGAFDCLGTSNRKIVNVDDPPSQPWVTSVGGTSLERYNPRSNPRPAYPAGAETVWNPDNLCNTRAREGTKPGSFWCQRTGAGGGGSSQFWGMPFYQFGPGIINQYTSYGNGSTHCSLAVVGTPCREVPDISADADEYTGYSEYCTGGAHTNSICAEFDGIQPHGWFPIGGTSLSAPLWTAIVADRDSFTGQRTGNLNPLIYLIYNLSPRSYFHDITGVGRPQATATSNGLYPTLPGYDLATGIGTPRMAALITRTE
jgi:subtilase family serine protease